MEENNLTPLSEHEVDNLKEYISRDPEEVQAVFNDVIEGSVEHHIRLQRYETCFSGPLPTPEILSGYANVDETFPERIFQMAEKDQKHRHEIDNKIIKSNNIQTIIGTTSAFVISIIVILVGVYMIMNGKSTQGLVAILLPLATLISVFYGRNKTEKSNNDQIEKTD